MQLPQMWRKVLRICMSGLYTDMYLFQNKSKTEALRISSTLQADSHPVVWSGASPQAASSPSVLRAARKRERGLGSSAHCVSSVGSKSWAELLLEMAPLPIWGSGRGLWSKGSHRSD